MYMSVNKYYEQRESGHEKSLPYHFQQEETRKKKLKIIHQNKYFWKE